ncbi:MAG: FixH family protein [Alphaproteobacteria bacterium]
MKKPINPSSFKIYWPYYLFAIFAIVVVVNIGYIFVANKTWRGIYTSKAYQKTSDYNKILEKIQEQRKLGFLVKNDIKKFGDNNFKIETFLTDLNNKVMSGINVIYILKYLPDAKFDKVLQGKIQANSFSYIDFKLEHAGTWELETAVSFNDKVIQDIYYFIIKPTDLK